MIDNISVSLLFIIRVFVMFLNFSPYFMLLDFLLDTDNCAIYEIDPSCDSGIPIESSSERGIQV